MKVSPRLTSFLLVVGVSLCLYLPFLTRNYDLNGLMEATALRTGRAGDLFTPNHMLYRPVAFGVQLLLKPLGLDPDVVKLLQALSAMFGALGIGFAFLAFERLTGRRSIAVWASLGLAVSWSYWTLSTDVYYFSLAGMLVAASLALFVYAESTLMFLACGVVAGLSVLACQANVFLLPGLAVATWLREPRVAMGAYVRRVVALALGSAACVGGVFAGVGVFVYERRTLSTLLEWGGNYSGNLLPMWGAWTPGRMVLVLGAAFKSLLGTELWLFQFFHRFLPNGELPAWFAPAAFVVGALCYLAVWRWGIVEKGGTRSPVLWLLLMYLAYVPFVIWWEAMEPRWFIMPNVMLAGSVAVLASRLPKSFLWNVALPALVLVLGALNFVTSAAPRRFVPSVPIQTAACVASHMTPNDLFLATEWNWAGYIDGVHGRPVLNFINEVSRTGSKAQALEAVAHAVAERQQQGGDVYMMDIQVYTPQYMQWLAEQTQITADDLRPYSGEHAFDCVYGSFFKLKK